METRIRKAMLIAIKKWSKHTTKKLIEQGYIYNASNWGSDRGLIKRL